ncbi:MAG: alpha amylase N-terminal ig-like domain-containing protein, partial [Lachnospiraceae bacterium]|nr:alpha amylase N-terminal ig-like domain-containing protein [Lachnospiraceae bacterium]
MITISAIRHVPLSEDAALSFGQTLEIRLRTRAGEPLEVSLFYGDR